jgi:hypothetical protein
MKIVSKAMHKLDDVQDLVIEKISEIEASNREGFTFEEFSELLHSVTAAQGDDGEFVEGEGDAIEGKSNYFSVWDKMCFRRVVLLSLPTCC